MILFKLLFLEEMMKAKRENDIKEIKKQQEKPKTRQLLLVGPEERRKVDLAVETDIRIPSNSKRKRKI